MRELAVVGGAEKRGVLGVVFIHLFFYSVFLSRV